MSSNNPTAPAPAHQFLQALDAEAETFTFQTFDDDADRADKSLARIFQGTLEDHAKALADLNQRGAGVFVTVNETDGAGRKADNIIRVRAVFVDLDGAELGPVQQCAIEPHIMVESSPGRYHAYWLVDDLPLDQFCGVQRAIADRFSGDGSVKDLPRVMRLPGYLHQKQAAFETKITDDNGGLPYPAEKILAEFPPVAPPQRTCAAISPDDKVTEGGRNVALTSMAGKMRRDGFSLEAIEAALQEENQKRCDPPLSEQEVQSIAASMAKYEPAVSEHEATLSKLAALDPITYDQQRKATADRLGIRPTTLDDEVAKRRPADPTSTDGKGPRMKQVTPWPHPVDGDKLVHALVAAFKRYSVLPVGAAETKSLWVLHAHAHDAAEVSPILTITSPDKQCGKSTVLRILKGLVPNPRNTVNITPATLFRVIDAQKPTLLIDEADAFIKGNEDLRCILDGGHVREDAYVDRCEGDSHTPTQFCVWAPKAIALIGQMHPTLMDRSIRIEMKRKLGSDKVERLRVGEKSLKDLASQACRWAQDHMEELRAAEPDVPAGLHNRPADNWEPLFAIADLVGGDWPEKARQIALQMVAQVEDESAAVMLLQDIKSIFEARGTDDISSVALCSDLEEMQDRPWPEWRQNKPITPTQVSRLLKEFGIAPDKFRMGPSKALQRGYKKSFFEDAWARYAPEPTGTPVQSPETMAYSVSAPGTKPNPVPDGNAPNPLETNACTGVPDGIGGQDVGAPAPGGNEERVAVPKPPPCKPPVPQSLPAVTARNGADDDPLAIPPFLRR